MSTMIFGMMAYETSGLHLITIAWERHTFCLSFYDQEKTISCHSFTMANFSVYGYHLLWCQQT